MLTLKNRKKGNVVINDWSDWTRPQHEYHWKPGRSAMELARAWFTSPTPQCPPEIQYLLAKQPRTAGMEFTEGYPEHETRLPARDSGCRNHDLMLKGHTVAENAIVCVEAKVDEAFDCTIRERLMAPRSANSAIPERMNALVSLVFGPAAQPNQVPWNALRYQLLTGVAGTLIEAANQSAEIGVFLVHEFQTSLADPMKLANNAADFEQFMSLLFQVQSAAPGELYGPITFHPGAHLPKKVDLFVGKVIHQWR